MDRLTSTIKCLGLPAVKQSTDASIIMFGIQPRIHALPGCTMVHTTAGVYTLDPTTLTPMPCKMLRARDSNEADGIPRPQFDIANCILIVLCVFNINWLSNEREQSIDGDKLLPEFADRMDSDTPVANVTVDDHSEACVTNSCCVAMAINSRLIVMKITGW